MASYFSDFMFQLRTKESQKIKNITFAVEGGDRNNLFPGLFPTDVDEDIFAISDIPPDDFDVFEI